MDSSCKNNSNRQSPLHLIADAYIFSMERSPYHPILFRKISTRLIYPQALFLLYRVPICILGVKSKRWGKTNKHCNLYKPSPEMCRTRWASFFALLFVLCFAPFSRLLSAVNQNLSEALILFPLFPCLVLMLFWAFPGNRESMLTLSTLCTFPQFFHRLFDRGWEFLCPPNGQTDDTIYPHPIEKPPQMLH